MKRVALLVAALALLAACSDPPKAGYVTAKHHEDAYDWVQMVCSAYDKNGQCTVQMPIMQHEPEHWKLCLRDDQDAKKTGCLDVPPQTWDRYSVGQHYPDPR